MRKYSYLFLEEPWFFLTLPILSITLSSCCHTRFWGKLIPILGAEENILNSWETLPSMLLKQLLLLLLQYMIWHQGGLIWNSSITLPLISQQLYLCLTKSTADLIILIGAQAFIVSRWIKLTNVPSSMIWAEYPGR